MYTEKKCFKCICVKPLPEFYKNSDMTDGHLNKCRQCMCAEASARRIAKLDTYAERNRQGQAWRRARLTLNASRVRVGDEVFAASRLGISSHQLADKLGRQHEHVTNALRDLKRAGFIDCTSRGRGAVWAPVSNIVGLRAAIAEKAKAAAAVRQAEKDKAEDEEHGHFTHVHRPAGTWQHNGPVANNSVFNLRA